MNCILCNERKPNYFGKCQCGISYLICSVCKNQLESPFGLFNYCYDCRNPFRSIPFISIPFIPPSVVEKPKSKPKSREIYFQKYLNSGMTFQQGLMVKEYYTFFLAAAVTQVVSTASTAPPYNMAGLSNKERAMYHINQAEMLYPDIAEHAQNELCREGKALIPENISQKIFGSSSRFQNELNKKLLNDEKLVLKQREKIAKRSVLNDSGGNCYILAQVAHTIFKLLDYNTQPYLKLKGVNVSQVYTQVHGDHNFLVVSPVDIPSLTGVPIRKLSDYKSSWGYIIDPWLKVVFPVQHITKYIKLFESNYRVNINNFTILKFDSNIRLGVDGLSFKHSEKSNKDKYKEIFEDYIEEIKKQYSTYISNFPIDKCFDKEICYDGNDYIIGNPFETRCENCKAYFKTSAGGYSKYCNKCGAYIRYIK